MPISADFTLNYTAKTIKHTSGTTRYTVNALYSWLMDLFDDAEQMDNPVPMSAQTPTEYTLINGWKFDSDADLGYLYGGSIVDTTNSDVWGNFYNIGTLKAGTILYIEQAGSLVASPPGYSSGDLDVLVKVVASGTPIASRKVSFFARNLGDTYDVFTATASATGGRNPIPISTATDLNDDPGTSGDGGITLTFGPTNKDIGDGDGPQPYDLVIDGAGMTTLQVYRALKWLTRRQSTANMDGIQGRFYRTLNASYAEVKNSPFGFYAGGKFFGARGVWLENISDANNIQLIDSDGDIRTPPLSFTVTVTSVQSGDRVLVARADGAGGIAYNQFTLNGAHSGGTVINVNEAVAADIPTAGVIRVGDTRYTYSALDRPGKQFQGVSPTVGSHGANSPAYVPLIDAVASGTSIASPAMQYVADFDVIARVRKFGIIPFENTGTVGSTGLTISAIRTTDPIVTP